MQRQGGISSTPNEGLFHVSIVLNTHLDSCSHLGCLRIRMNGEAVEIMVGNAMNGLEVANRHDGNVQLSATSLATVQNLAAAALEAGMAKAAGREVEAVCHRVVEAAASLDSRDAERFLGSSDLVRACQAATACDSVDQMFLMEKLMCFDRELKAVDQAEGEVIHVPYLYGDSDFVQFARLREAESNRDVSANADKIRNILQECLQLEAVADMDFQGIQLVGSVASGTALPGKHDVDLVCVWRLGESGVFRRAAALSSLRQSVEKSGRWIGLRIVEERRCIAHAEGLKCRFWLPSSCRYVYSEYDVDLMVGAAVEPSAKLLLPDRWYASLNIYKSLMVSKLPRDVRLATLVLKVWRKACIPRLSQVLDEDEGHSPVLVPSSFVLSLMAAAVHDFLSSRTSPTVKMICCGVWQLVLEASRGTGVTVYTHHIAQRILGTKMSDPLLSYPGQDGRLEVMDPLNMRCSCSAGWGRGDVWEALGEECYEALLRAGFRSDSGFAQPYCPIDMEHWQAHVRMIEDGLAVKEHNSDTGRFYFVEPDIVFITGCEADDNHLGQEHDSARENPALARFLSNFVSRAEPTSLLLGDEPKLIKQVREILSSMTFRGKVGVLVVYMDDIQCHLLGHSEEALAHTFAAAARNAPCVLVLPLFDAWLLDETFGTHQVLLRTKFRELMQDLPSGVAVLASSLRQVQPEPLQSAVARVCG